MIDIQLESLAFGGDSVGHHQGKAVFVPGGAPGDRARVKLVSEKKKFARGELMELLEPGPNRRQPPCEMADRCGGCQWQQVDYPGQLAAKDAIVQRALGRKVGEVLPTVAAPQELGYRRRVRLHFQIAGSGHVRLGYRQLRGRDILSIRRCPVLVGALERALPACHEALSRLPRGSGTLVMVAGRGDEVLISLRSKAGRGSWTKPLAPLVDQGVLSGGVVDEGRRQWPFGATTVTLSHEDGPPLRQAAGAFAQANAQQDRALHDAVLAAAEPQGADLLELYAGAGNFSVALAGRVRRATVVESSPIAGRWLADNLSNFKGMTVVKQTVEQAVARLVHDGASFDCVLLDPPREGVEAETLAALASLAAPRLVYVSCDPMVLARDLARLDQAGYGAVTAQPFDLMPQTFHLETVVRLDRR